MGKPSGLPARQPGVCLFAATGSGKTSGPDKHRAYGYLAAGPEPVHGLREGR